MPRHLPRSLSSMSAGKGVTGASWNFGSGLVKLKRMCSWGGTKLRVRSRLANTSMGLDTFHVSGVNRRKEGTTVM